MYFPHVATRFCVLRLGAKGKGRGEPGRGWGRARPVSPFDIYLYPFLRPPLPLPLPTHLLLPLHAFYQLYRREQVTSAEEEPAPRATPEAPDGPRRGDAGGRARGWSEERAPAAAGPGRPSPSQKAPSEQFVRKPEPQARLDELWGPRRGFLGQSVPVLAPIHPVGPDPVSRHPPPAPMPT